MKKLYTWAAFYAIIGMAGGVFFREFTKFHNFDGTTALGFVHTHAFVLGMLFMFIVLILEKLFQLSAYSKYRYFMLFYNSGLIITIIMLIIRGIPQVLQLTLTAGVNGAISGIAGIGHIMLAVGLIFFFLALKKQIKC